MKVSYCDKQAAGVVAYAASELTDYLERMVYDLQKESWEIHLETGLGEGIPAEGEKDFFRVSISEKGGTITGNNDRSVLLGVYDYLRCLGCRFLMPGKAYEIVPSLSKEKLPAAYEKQASFMHRGVCIEGADSYENIRDFIDWLPKAGYNSFFLQFKNPYAFLARWYNHERNPYKEAEGFSLEDAASCMKRLETEMKKRGLLLHRAGHGWTGEVLGFQSDSWQVAEQPLEPEAEKYAAMIGGVRGLYRGIPANTNLCYHSRMAVDQFAAQVVQFAEENPGTDYIHVWLADECNNVCECGDCRRTTLSDQYVKLLNEIDRRLSEQKLGARIVFLLYQELLWPPVKERIMNQERFVLMFAPISRTFEASYPLEDIPDRLPEYVRNQVTLPVNLGENLAFLKEWQKRFSGESFVYDYPLGRAHYGDFGYVHIARVIGGDIKRLKEMGLDGYISCQELRAACPNALPGYVMGYTLFDEKADTEAMIREYFEAAYGEGAENVRKYLEKLSKFSSSDYLNGKGPRRNPEMAERLKVIMHCCEEFVPVPEQEENIYWRILQYHRGFILRLAEAMYYIAKGEDALAAEKWKNMREYVCRGEEQYQPCLDAYRILEVTENYTGFHKALESARMRKGKETE